MPKTSSGIKVSQGTGPELSTFNLASGRRRQTVVIGDADDTGEAQLIEVPAHDAVDRGGALKIGGRAASAPFPSVFPADRTDAWFSLEGQQGVVATLERNVAYDGGRRPITSTAANFNLNNAGLNLVAAAPGLKTKVIGVSVAAATVTTPGTAYFQGPALLFFIGRIASTNTNISFGFGGTVLCETAVNTALQFFFDGNAIGGVTVTYYQAP